MDKRTVDKLYGVLLAAALGIIALGTVFYHLQEHLSWLNAYYFSVITLTTVGYGDIVPHTDLGKLFTTFYVLAGVGIITSFITITMRRRADNMLDRRSKNDKSNTRTD